VVRILRVGTVSLAATGLAVAAHALTDGCVEPVGALLALGCAAPAAIALTARQRTAHAVLWWLVAVQVALHLILAAGCDSPSGRLLPLCWRRTCWRPPQRPRCCAAPTPGSGQQIGCAT